MSILIIRPCNGIGDMVWALPTIRGLASKFGKATIVSKPRSFSKEWLSLDDSIESVLYTNELSILLKNYKKFDASCVLHRSFSYSIIPILLNIKIRMGFGGKQLLNQVGSDNPNDHPIDAMKSMMKNLDIKMGSSKPPLIKKMKVFNAIKSYPKPWIGLGIGCSEFNRILPLKTFKQIISEINGTFFILGGKMDKKASFSLHKYSEKTVLLEGQQSINESFLLASYMDFYIGHDTGMMNVAANFNIRSLVFFSGQKPLNYLSNIYSVETIEDCKKIINSSEFVKN